MIIGIFAVVHSKLFEQVDWGQNWRFYNIKKVPLHTESLVLICLAVSDVLTKPKSHLMLFSKISYQFDHWTFQSKTEIEKPGLWCIKRAKLNPTKCHCFNIIMIKLNIIILSRFTVMVILSMWMKVWWFGITPADWPIWILVLKKIQSQIFQIC